MTLDEVIKYADEAIKHAEKVSELNELFEENCLNGEGKRMTIAERNEKLKYFIACLKCEVSGTCCNDNCPIQCHAGTLGEIIENLEAISRVIEQQSCEDYISREDAITKG